jgi:ABC-type lipoprotein release transport system permease subunit
MLFESLPYPRARRPRAVVLSRFCFGISRLDPATYAGVTLLLLGVATLACLAPAWRAARVDPAITLRAE